MTWLRWLIGVGGVLLVATPGMAGPVTAVTAGEHHTCALTSGGGVSCWGLNSSAQLGDGTTTRRLTPVAVSGLASGVTAVAAGGGHTCALTSGGGVVCWGNNTSGRLGDGTTTDRRTPVAVSGLSSGVIAIATGDGHTCALTRGGGVACWGYNFYGQLGDGTTTNRSTPVAVSGLSSGVTAVAAGTVHTCALTSGGAVVCWGYNEGQLGDGTTTDRLTPVAVSGLSSGVIAVATGYFHTCALTSGGGVVCWGYNSRGQLGDGTTTTRLTPVAVSGLSSGVTAVATGWVHTCALTSGGAVVCWGANFYGQLGDGTTTDRLTPMAVSGLSSGVTAVATGDVHTCALTSGGGVVCWGDNAYGQLGDGTTTTRLTPVTANFGLSLPGLTFAATNTGTALSAQTAAQTVRLTPGVGTAVTWTATSNKPWLTVTPASGSGSTALSIAVKFDSSLPASGAVTGAITLALTGAANPVGPINVTLTVVSSTAPISPPFGVVDTPVGDATVLAGSIAVTGWTLDNIGVQRVELWRDLQPGETTPPFTSTPSDPRSGKVFISNATFVDGARPDVEGLYPTAPVNSRAGWGYLLLTWGLWNQGNGTYKLYAFAFDQENNVATIGSKTIVVNNNTATKPFGSIDIPGIGAVVTAFAQPNVGWALTPPDSRGCKILSNGVQVSIDSGPPTQVVYGDQRADVEAALPGFSNSAAPGGHFSFNPADFTDGVHTIGWLVTDDCNRAEGIGSRFFTISSPVTRMTSSPPEFRLKAETTGEAGGDSGDLLLSRGYGELPKVVEPDLAGSRTIEVKQGERIELRLPPGFDRAYQVGPAAQDRPLPIGSTWDNEAGIFCWQPAPGFLGPFRLVFSNGTERISARVVVMP